MIAKVVIDTNIYISAIFWGGKPREVVDLGRDENILIFTSLDIDEEISQKLRTKFKLDEEEVRLRSEFRWYVMIPTMTSSLSVLFLAMQTILFPAIGIY